MENKALLYSLLGSGGVVLALALGVIPEFAQQFEIVEFPPKVSEASYGTVRFPPSRSMSRPTCNNQGWRG